MHLAGWLTPNWLPPCLHRHAPCRLATRRECGISVSHHLVAQGQKLVRAGWRCICASVHRWVPPQQAGLGWERLGEQHVPYGQHFFNGALLHCGRALHTCSGDVQTLSPG